MATYLATLDNPENNICPGLRTPKAPPAALSSLVFTPTLKIPLRDEGAAPASPTRPSSAATPKSSASGITSRPSRGRDGNVNGYTTSPKDRPTSTSKDGDGQSAPPGPDFLVSEEAASKDYRSFTANVFSTVAFKMLEWLTPASIEEMSRRAETFQTSRASSRPAPLKEIKTRTGSGSVSPRSKSLQESPVLPSESHGDATRHRGIHGPGQNGKAEKPSKEEKGAKEDQQNGLSSPISRPRSQRRNSNAKLRATQGPKPSRQLSIDPFASDTISEDTYPPLVKSPRPNGANTDRAPRGIKTANPALARPISQLSSAGYFDDVTLEKMPPPRAVEFKPKVGRSQMDGARSSDSGSPKDPNPGSGTSSSRSCSNNSANAGEDSETDDDSVLPQALSRLNADVVDFICDVVQEDGTSEKHMLEPPSVTRFHNRYSNQGKPLRRKSRSGPLRGPNVRLEWKIFVEQTLFYILSDPLLAVRSFTKRGQLYDSQTLWYCMLRMTRIAPSLVFHSLWMASASLFPPPKSLQRYPTAKVFPKHEKSLSNVEAGRLISICLHALIAAAPLVATDRQLYDMSRIRAHGLSLAGSGSVAEQPASLCLQYEDCFTDDLALRLAKRLFAAIVTRRYYDEINDAAHLYEKEEKEPDVLTPLFSQLDFLNMDAVYILNFSFPDRALHETRVPILLLDWARAVMLSDWNGKPEIPGDGPFGGALALIDAMCKAFTVRADFIDPVH